MSGMNDIIGGVTASVSGGVRDLYNGILGGVARQLPISIPGVSSDSLPSAAEELNYLSGPETSPLFTVNIFCPDGDNGRKQVNVNAYLDSASGVSISTGAEYNAPFDKGLLETMGAPEVVTDVMRMMGVRTVTKSMTSQVWQGSQHIAMELPLLFIAEADAEREVMAQVKALMSLTLPAVDGNRFLSAPGPRVEFKSPQKKEGGDSLLGSVKKMSDSAINAGLGLGTGADPSSSQVGNAPNGSLIEIGGFKSAFESFTQIFDAIEAANPTVISIGAFMRFPSVVVKNVQVQFDDMYDRRGLPMVARVTISFETHQIPTVQDLDQMLPSGGQPNLQKAAEAILGAGIGNLLGGGL